MDEGAAFAELARLSRQKFDPKESARFLSELSSANDRTFVIVWFTLLDDALSAFLSRKMSHLSKVDRKLMLGPTGVLATFKSKILMAYAAGWLALDWYNDLDMIRKIRNACAHSASYIDFETECVVVACKAMSEAFAHEGISTRAEFSLRCLDMWQTMGDFKALFPMSLADGTVFPEPNWQVEPPSWLDKHE